MLQVPKKLDMDSYRSVATLPPDSYILLEDDRRVAEVLQDYEARGAENKLLLKRKRFDTSDADFSKPQFIALTTVCILPYYMITVLHNWCDTVHHKEINWSIAACLCQMKIRSTYLPCIQIMIFLHPGTDIMAPQHPGHKH